MPNRLFSFNPTAALRGAVSEVIEGYFSTDKRLVSPEIEIILGDPCKRKELFDGFNKMGDETPVSTVEIKISDDETLVVS